MRTSLLLFALSCVLLATFACSDSGGDEDGGDPTGTPSGPDGGDGGQPLTDGGSDGGEDGPDGGSNPTPVAEQEPNDGTNAEDVNPFDAGTTLTGAVSPADDADVFSTTLGAGELWRWTLSSEGSAFAPHLAVVEHANQAPPSVGVGAASQATTVEAFVLRPGRYNVIVRDARNVPASSSQHQGSASHAWRLTSTRDARSPTAVAVPSRTPATLASPFAVQLFSFTLSSQTDVEVGVYAKRKASPSNLDTRLSLLRTNDQAWFGTNDDLSGSQTDSQLGGLLPPGTYVVVVDNVDPAATQLGFELDVAVK